MVLMQLQTEVLVEVAVVVIHCAAMGTGGDGADGVVIVRYKKLFAGNTITQNYFIN